MKSTYCTEAVLVALLTCTGVYAHAEERTLGGLDDFNPWFRGICGQLVRSMMASPQYAVVLEVRPINEAEACSCASAAVLKDEKLQRNFGGSRQEVNERLRESILGSYFGVRTTTAILTCLAADLEKSLAVVKLQK